MSKAVEKPRVLLVGKPNSGKSLLFNKLTGLRHHVSNFPGATVTINEGESAGVIYVDHPGIYAMTPLTSDEHVSLEALKASLASPEVRALICVLDVTRLEASLNVGLLVRDWAEKHAKPVVFALNMADEIKSSDLAKYVDELAHALAAPVKAVSARTGFGLEALVKEVERLLDAPAHLAEAKTQLPVVDEQTFTTARRLSRRFEDLSAPTLRRQLRLDRFFLSSWLGGVVFLSIMLLIFQAIFTWAEPLMGAVEWLVAWVGESVTGSLHEGLLKDFLVEAVFNGVGAFLVFIPQIFMLTFLIGVLEDSGYLARAAMICHKPLSLFGLDGKSFVPYLSAHACAIPAILACRTLDSPRRRLITMLTIPLVVCSARLPVYSMVIAAVIPSVNLVGGLIGLQGLVFFSMYIFGIMMALIIAGVLQRLSGETAKEDAPFVLELPPYRWPHWKPLLLKSMNTAYQFVRNAGLVIALATAGVWALGYFPYGSGHLDTSYLSWLGRALEPIFAQLGLDWMFGVAILASFLAREVFVGTLGTLYGIANAGDDFTGLAQRLMGELSLASGIALLVFYGIALQCVSTVAVLARETGRRRDAWTILVAYGVLAYVAAWLAYRLMSIFVA